MDGSFAICAILAIAYYGSYVESERIVESCKEFGIAKMKNDTTIKCEIVSKIHTN